MGIKSKGYIFYHQSMTKIFCWFHKFLFYDLYFECRIQSKDNRIGTYEINKIFLSCFDDKIYILNNGYDKLALGYKS